MSHGLYPLEWHNRYTISWICFISGIFITSLCGLGCDADLLLMIQPIFVREVKLKHTEHACSVYKFTKSNQGYKAHSTQQYQRVSVRQLHKLDEAFATKWPVLSVTAVQPEQTTRNIRLSSQMSALCSPKNENWNYIFWIPLFQIHTRLFQGWGRDYKVRWLDELHVLPVSHLNLSFLVRVTSKRKPERTRIRLIDCPL